MSVKTADIDLLETVSREDGSYKDFTRKLNAYLKAHGLNERRKGCLRSGGEHEVIRRARDARLDAVWRERDGRTR